MSYNYYLVLILTTYNKVTKKSTNFKFFEMKKFIETVGIGFVINLK